MKLSILSFLFLLASCQQVDQNISSGGWCAGSSSTTECVHLTSPANPTNLTLDKIGTNSLSSLPTLSWSHSESAIVGYEVALGSMPGASDLLNWTNIGLVNSYKFKNLTLTECRQYFPSLRAVDKDGQKTTVTMESGFYFDKTAPSMLSTVSATHFDGYYDRTVTASWDSSKVTDNCEYFGYQLAVGTSPGATNILNWKSFKAVSKKQIHDEELNSPLNLHRGVNYYTSLRVIDAGGNVSSLATSPAWHFYDPLEISSITFWGDFSDYKTLFKDSGCSIRVAANGDNIACVQDRSGSIGTLTKPTFPQPKVAASLSNGNNRISMDGTFLVSSALSMNSLMLVHKSPSSNSGWNYLMDWRNTIADSWWSPAVGSGIGIFWNSLYLHGTLTPISPAVLFDNNLNVSYFSGSSLMHNSILHLGARFTENEFSHGEYGEIFILNSVLTQFERQKLEGYLACKWGTQMNLPTLHPYKINCPN